MGSNVNKMLMFATMALLFVIAASASSVMLQQMSAATEAVERMTSSMHRNVLPNKSADVDMRNVEHIVKGTVAIQSIRHIEEIGVRIRVNGTLYTPTSAPSQPNVPTNPGNLPTMPDERVDTFEINPNDNYSVTYVYQNGNLYEVVFTRK